MTYEQRMNFVKISVVVIVILFFAFNRYVINRAKRWDFKGTVKSVGYDEKHNPTILTAGNEYYLGSTAWDSDILINVGDTVIKHAGSLSIYLIRPNTHDTIKCIEKRNSLGLSW